jgi:hypothetical protein
MKLISFLPLNRFQKAFLHIFVHPIWPIVAKYLIINFNGQFIIKAYFVNAFIVEK